MVGLADLRDPWGGAWGRSGPFWSDPGSSRVGFGRAREGPEGKGTALGGSKGGLGTHFGDPGESAYSPNIHICEFVLRF